MAFENPYAHAIEMVFTACTFWGDAPEGSLHFKEIIS
jgi:hypothetical protein